MPISYEPPQPFAPSISQGYGAAEQGVQDLPLIQRAQEQVAANRRAELGAVQQSNALAAQAGQANADRQSAEAARGAAVREQAYQFDESRRPSDRDYFQADVGFQQTQQRFALHAQMQQQELSQAETMRLQRLQQAKGTIQQQVDEGQLTPAEGNSLMLQAQTGINPLQQRQAAAKVKLEQLQAEQVMHQQAQQKTFELQNQEHEAKAKAQGIGVLKRLNPHTGAEETLFQNPKTGEWYNPWISHDQLTDEQRGKQEKEAANLDAIRLKDYSTAVQRIEKANELWTDRRDKKDEAMAKQNGRPPEPLTPEQIQQNFESDMKKAGLELTWEGQRAKMAGRDAAARQPVNVTGSGPQPPTQAGPPQQRPLPAELRKPFEDDTKASEPQKNQLASLRDQTRQVDAMRIPEEEKAAYRGATDTIEELMRKYGDVSAAGIGRMSEDDQRRLTEARVTRDRVKALTQPPPYQPAPPPGVPQPRSMFAPAPLSSFRPPARRS